MDRRHELARHEAQEDAGREVVFAQAMGEVRVLREGVAEGQGDGVQEDVGDWGAEFGFGFVGVGVGIGIGGGFMAFGAEFEADSSRQAAGVFDPQHQGEEREVVEAGEPGV